MSEVLVVYDAAIAGADGRNWTAQACGRVAEDGLWEGWLEFLPRAADSLPVQTGRETKQPNRNDLLYWAEGLTRTYLSGALDRALARNDPTTAAQEIRAHPVFDAPAKKTMHPIETSARRAVLNPFDVHLQGEGLLRDQLAALDAPKLRDIAVAYAFGDTDQIARMGRDELSSLIVARVREIRPRRAPEADLRDGP